MSEREREEAQKPQLKDAPQRPRRPGKPRSLMSEDEKFSRALSKTLRHKAKAQGFSIDAEGYVPVAELLASSIFKGLDAAKLDEIVATNAKKRYEFSPDRLRIRATQGHSVPVTLDTHTPLTLETVPAVVVHGTTREAWMVIKTQGLKAMNRQHIHMAQGLDVISGMRKNSQIKVYVEAKRAMEAGIKFLLSSNGVVLSPGPIGPEFLSLESAGGGCAKSAAEDLASV